MQKAQLEHCYNGNIREPLEQSFGSMFGLKVPSHPTSPRTLTGWLVPSRTWCLHPQPPRPTQAHQSPEAASAMPQ